MKSILNDWIEKKKEIHKLNQDFMDLPIGTHDDVYDNLDSKLRELEQEEQQLAHKIIFEHDFDEDLILSIIRKY